MKKILIIEDVFQIREIIQEILDSEGFETLVACNGAVGVSLAKEHKPDVIFCDLMMPELDGFGVLAALGESPTTASIPVIILTALSEEFNGQKAIEMGAVGYLTKPFLCSDLLEALKSFIKPS